MRIVALTEDEEGGPANGIRWLLANRRDLIDADDVRAHGRDERIGVKEFYNGVEFMYRLMKELSSGSQPGKK